MDGFTLVDGAVAVVIVLSAVLAYARGFVREALAIAGWVLAAVLAYLYAPRAEPLVAEIPILRDFLDNCVASTIAAFAGVFALVLVATALFTPLFSALIRQTALNTVDQGLGFLFGALRGMLLVVIALIVHDFVTGAEGLRIVEDSRSAQVFATAQARIAGELANQDQLLTWLTGRFESLIDRSCGTGAAPPPLEPLEPLEPLAPVEGITG